MNKRRLVTGALAALTVAALTACGGAAGDGASDKKLIYWSMWSEGEGQQQAIAAALEEFTAETGIEVDVQWIGRDVGQSVIPRLNAGNPPDLVDGGSDLLNSYGVDNLHDLTAVYDTTIPGEDITVREALIEPLIAEVSDEEGVPRLAPYLLVGSSVWYNNLVTPQLGESTPATWDELIAVLDELKASGRTPVALDGDIADYQAYWILWALMRTGGVGTLSDAAMDESGDGFETDAWQRATEAIQQLIDGDYFPAGYDGTKFPTQQSAWADQTSKTDLILMGSWLPTEATTSLSSQGLDVNEMVEFRSFPFPSISPEDEGIGVVDAGPTGFVIPEKAANKEAAEQFIAFFLGKERIERIASIAKSMPSRADVEPPADLAGYADEYANATAFFATNDGLYNTAPKWVVDVWHPAVQAFFNKSLDAAAFREELAERTRIYHESN